MFGRNGDLRFGEAAVLICIMSNLGGRSYNLRETMDRDERNWHAQMEQRMTIMVKTYQTAIHDMRSAQDQRLADIVQSQERNMARILELMQQGKTGVAERALERHRPNPSFVPIHEDHPVEEGAVLLQLQMQLQWPYL
ncbi:hypothetical protein Syun_027915 [Stephania yunnanensis]|uniref:Uncharacterized protein n=1 Tax=Stephania yunnanensis TaxID=152371 RepID=A0AAP0EGT4_9MAGN